jgi:DNA invertase Pin-like site-specific DNA recombinase
MGQKRQRCAIYTRKSTAAGLEQDFNSLDAQREACEAYIKSQAHEGWKLLPQRYDDGGISGGTLDRPDLQRLLTDIEAGLVDVIVVYKVDRLTRSLTDFAKLVEVLDGHGVSFVSVTQQFNTTTSMGRLTLNVLLSFAQFEREVIGERIRDKVAQSKAKGIWMGGPVPLGYDLGDRELLVNPTEAELVREIYELYLEKGSVRALKVELDRRGVRSKVRHQKNGRVTGGGPFSRGHLYCLLANPIYIGKLPHKGKLHDGKHDAIIEPGDLRRPEADPEPCGETGSKVSLLHRTALGAERWCRDQGRALCRRGSRESRACDPAAVPEQPGGDRGCTGDW